MSNVDKLRRAYQAWDETRGASVQQWLELLADDVVIRSLAENEPSLEFAERRRGRAQAEQYFAALAKEWEMIYFSVDEFISEGDRVVAIGRCAWRHRRTGKSVESPKVDIWRFRDGKATEVFELYDTAKAFEAAQG
jgi:ketosteroid isomerase-like protein